MLLAALSPAAVMAQYGEIHGVPNIVPEKVVMQRPGDGSVGAAMTYLDRHLFVGMDIEDGVSELLLHVVDDEGDMETISCLHESDSKVKWFLNISMLNGTPAIVYTGRDESDIWLRLVRLDENLDVILTKEIVRYPREESEGCRYSCPFPDLLPDTGGTLSIRFVANNIGIANPPYSPYYPRHRFLRIDAQGDILVDNTVETMSSFGNNQAEFIHNTDSTGYFLLDMSDTLYGLLSLDKDFIPDGSRRFNYDGMGVMEHVYRHPTNGDIYTFGHYSYPAVNNSPQYHEDVCVARWDANLNMKAMWLGMYSPEENDMTSNCCVSFMDDGSFWVLGANNQPIFLNEEAMKLGSFIYACHLDENFGEISEFCYRDPVFCEFSESVVATDDGCMVSSFHFNPSSAVEAYEYMIYKFTWIDGVETHCDETASSVYPNPGGSTLNIRTALTGSHVELYDTGGRLVCRQEITGAVTSINTEKLPSGVYVWKVIKDGSEAESGKWVKE